MAGRTPAPRHASLAKVYDAGGSLIDEALLLWFPGPNSATGEDVAELHLHGGRAVIDAALAALGQMAGLRAAQPGEFTRRALDNGAMDLMAAEGLADLLAAETALQREQALAMRGNAVSQRIDGWNGALLALSAAVEAALDFADEDDVEAGLPAAWGDGMAKLTADMEQWLSVPPAERLRDGIMLVIAGPPNSGKSTLINALSGSDVAIVSAQAGTTRDVVEVPLAIDSIAFRIADTAGLHAGTGDAVEAEGMVRARDRVAAAQIVLWLGEAGDAPVPERPDAVVIRVAARADVCAAEAGWDAVVASSDVVLSARTGEGMAALAARIVAAARTLLPRAGEVALNRRQRAEVALAHDALSMAADESDLVLVADHLRLARAAIDRLTGKAGTEAMLDALFGQFCIGK